MYDKYSCYGMSNKEIIIPLVGFFSFFIGVIALIVWAIHPSDADIHEKNLAECTSLGKNLKSESKLIGETCYVKGWGK